MRRARSPMAGRRPFALCSIALLLVVSACSPYVSLAAEHSASFQQTDMELQAAEQLLAPAPSLATAVAPLAAIAPLAAGAPLAAVAPEVALAVAAAAPTVAEAFAAPASKTPELPKLNAISFLGLPALPPVPLPYRDESAPAPQAVESTAQASATAPAPASASITGKSLVTSFVESFIDTALPPSARGIASAAVTGAPLPSASQVLASFTQAIPAEAPPPAAALKVANPGGKSLVTVPFPTVNTIFSALEKIGRRRLLADGAPALAPGPQAGPFPVLTSLESNGNQANPNADTAFAENQWYSTSAEGQPGMPGQPQPAAQLNAQPMQPMPNPGQPQPQPQPQPLQNVQLQVDFPGMPFGAQAPEAAQAPAGAQPAQPLPQPQAPQPSPVQALFGGPSAAPALFGGPSAAPAPRAFGPIPAEVKVFTERLVNFLGAEARSQLPKRIEVNAGAGRRRLAQDGPNSEAGQPLPAEPLAAQAPMSAPGGLPGPTFQALPEPLPLPPLPRPAPQLQAQPVESTMGPMSAPAGESQPGAILQARPADARHHKMAYIGTTGRKLQQGTPELPNPASFEPAVPVEEAQAQTFAAQAPMSAPGGQGGPTFQALPEPAPLPPLPRPAQQLQTQQPEEPTMAPSMAPMSAPAGEAQPRAEYQARPAEARHNKMGYFGTTGRKLQQGPPELPNPASSDPAIPVEEARAQEFAAQAPMSAPGGMPQPGPTFQALPEPAPLPPLPRPTQQLQVQPEMPMAMAPSMGPMSAPAGQASAEYQARPADARHQKMGYFGTTGRHLLQGPPELPNPASFEPAIPVEEAHAQAFAAQAPMSAPGGRGGPTFQALPEPAPLPPLPRPAQPEATMGPTSAPAGEGQPAATTLQARPAEAHHDKMAYFGTTGRKLQQGPPGTVPEGVNETEADAAMTPMAAPGGMPQPGPTFQALPEPLPLPPLPRPAPQLQAQPEMPTMGPMSAPAGESQPATMLQSTNAEHVNRPAHKAKTATTTGRKLQATAPAPAPEQGPGARRTDMPPLPPIGPGMPMQAQAPQPGAMPAEGGPQGPNNQSGNVGVFQAADSMNNDAPSINMPIEYQQGLINAFKQALPSYISNAISSAAAGR